MGEATDRKVTEIIETRRRLEADLSELEAHIPAPVRSVKGLVGVVLGSTVLGGLAVRLLRSRSKRSRGDDHEVVIRIVRDDS
jgi:hypothetical protein